MKFLPLLLQIFFLSLELVLLTNHIWLHHYSQHQLHQAEIAQEDQSYAEKSRHLWDHIGL